MACYHPLRAAFQGYFNGKPEYKVVGAWLDFALGYDPRDKRVPCGHCIGCKLDYSRTWADRMMLELDHTKKGIFGTLTYDDDHLQYILDSATGELAPTLCKRDVQLFLKRLRKQYAPAEIRFFLSGEYGPRTSRPHYHFILFGLDLDDVPDLQLCGRNKFGQNYYTSTLWSDRWSNGFISLSAVSWQTCAYVARYVVKKLPSNFDLDLNECVQQPFSLMSRRPGIAGYFLDDHPECLAESQVYIDDPNGVKSVKKVRNPKYLFERLEKVDPILYNQLKADRERYAVDRYLIELHSTDLDELEYLKVKEHKKISALDKLKRPVF